MICRICGSRAADGTLFLDWVKPTFMDWDKLRPGKIICADCLFWFDERSEELAALVGKEKPQRMRNYSHFIVDGKWRPLSKGNKLQMRDILMGKPFPELAAIAMSGQKHLVFRATRNPLGAEAGWVQVEEQSLYLVPAELIAVLEPIERLHSGGFSKSEIETGDYAGYRVIKFGLEQWEALEQRIAPQRGSLLFALALFLAQKKGDSSGRHQAASDQSAGDPVAGGTGGLQEPLPDEHLDTVREPDQEQRLHERPRQMHLFSVPEIE